MQAIAELPEHILAADKLMSADEPQNIIRYLAAHPKDGDVMEGTRWCAQIAMAM